ncbi:f-box protein [Grosmannia clavigera kw1407]|uniref:F-box protein n=1 Tax=Grosmannia clavigera (strain kw1407 / UAMH 11150) TaxID=655863 RepID=F0XN37_GROCL|nr:f-box protein [Grosmannia clavigera kw1407]EFX00855.1 f-box protein [Grosmannia clavigera kw1407]
MSQQPGEGADTQISSELESFRQQWRAEVKAKTTAPARAGKSGLGNAGSSSRPQTYAESSVQHRSPPLPAAGTGVPSAPLTLLSSGKKPVTRDEDESYIQPLSFDEPSVSAKGGDSEDAHHGSQGEPQEPVSALEHYEKAVEKEELGSLGDSLRLYRKAFRMDSAVDKKYKNKHFPAPAPTASTGKTAATSEGAEKHEHAASGSGTAAAKPDAKPLTMNELIASFAGLAIEAAPPPIEGMPELPCPLASLPGEILVQILGDVAALDVDDFVRLARVCKKLAYVVAKEDQIWRRVCVESACGFGGMRRTWQTTIEWKPLRVDLLGEGGDLGGLEDGVEAVETKGWVEDEEEVRRRREAEQAAAEATTLALRTRSIYTSWQHMFRARPRVRFNGCYICTVNYIRPGQASANLVTWNSPVHIVTYFRYLRFFRDGTVIGLLTTSEPADVVHHLTRDQTLQHRDGAMKYAMRGRWRMSGIGAAQDSQDSPDSPEAFSSLAAATAAENKIVVETEGVGKYYNRMEFTMQTAGKGTRNNKLNWRGFYSYNRLTDDWGEFGLKNDKPFFFSRVRSYGLGE